MMLSSVSLCGETSSFHAASTYDSSVASMKREAEEMPIKRLHHPMIGVVLRT